MRALVLALTPAILLVGCGGATSYYPQARSEIAPAPAAAEGYGTLYIYRLWQPGSDRTKITYFVNEELVATLEALQYTWLHLPLGSHRVTARITGLFKDEWVPTKQIEIKEGTARFISAAAKFEGRQSFNFLPIVLSAGKIAYLPVPEAYMAEVGRLWVYSDDGFIDRLNGYRYVPPISQTDKSKP